MEMLQEGCRKFLTEDILLGDLYRTKKEKVLGVQLLQKRQVVQERSAEQRRETAERQWAWGGDTLYFLQWSQLQSCFSVYLQLRADVTGRIKTVAALETELSELREENDAYESQVKSDVDLNRIKKIAIGRLGMNYPRDDQKKTYSMSNNSYVRQYQDIPRSK